jgi:hypothetical protein
MLGEARGALPIRFSAHEHLTSWSKVSRYGFCFAHGDLIAAAAIRECFEQHRLSAA